MKKPIIKTRTYYEIPEYDRGDSKYLEYNLSTWDEIYFKSDDFGFIYNENTRNLRIPSGYSEDQIFKYLKRKIQYDNSYNKFNRIDINLTAPPRDEKQRSVITFICYYKTNALISTPSDNSKIIDQWYDSFVKFTTLKPKEILKIKGSQMCRDILDDKYNDKKIFILPRSTSAAFIRADGEAAYTKLLEKMKIGAHYIDEAHKDTNTMIKLLSYSKVYRTVFITATFGRSDKKENEVYKKLFGKIPRFGSRMKQSNEKHIEVKILRFRLQPTFKERKQAKTKYGLNAIRYTKFLMKYEEEFIEILDSSFDYTMSFRQNDGRLLILVPSIAMIKFIANYFREEYPQYTVGEYHSEIPKKKRGKELKRDIVIATEKGMGTGAEFENHQLTINFLAYSSDILGKQISGRNRKYKGRHSIYVEPVNIAFPEILNQYYKRRPALQSKSKDNKIEIIDITSEMRFKAYENKTAGIYYGISNELQFKFKKSMMRK